MQEFSFYNQLHVKTNNKNYEFLKYRNIGIYSSNLKIAKSFDEGKTIINNSCLKIVEHKTHLLKTVIQRLDIELIPRFPVLLKLVNSVENEKKLLGIKNEWIEIFMKFLKSIFKIELQNKLNQNEKKAFHYFVLEK